MLDVLSSRLYENLIKPPASFQAILNLIQSIFIFFLSMMSWGRYRDANFISKFSLAQYRVTDLVAGGIDEFTEKGIFEGVLLYQLPTQRYR